MANKVAPVPKGFRTLTPYLTVGDAAAAIDFYKAAFDAREQARVTAEDGRRILHAELKIGNSILLIADELPEAGILSPLSLGGSATLMQLYVGDAEALWQQALAAGAVEVLPLAETYWGDMAGKLMDPFGHYWSVASKREKLSHAEIAARAQAGGAAGATAPLAP